jgi:hypothetical protein
MAARVISLVLVLLLAVKAVACPFCTAVKPSIAERVEQADRAALVEVITVGAQESTFVVRQPLATGNNVTGDQGTGEKLAARQSLAIPARDVSGAYRTGQLALLMAMRDAESQRLIWEVTPLDEVAYAYVARSPSRRLPATERLPYFARFLENANQTIAEDAYLEFGAASFDQVAQVADRLPMASLRRWIADPKIPEARQGFYGLALGLAKTDADRRANQAVLQQRVDASADDFRAGFDGVLGGYLLLAGRAGLAHVEATLLANPQAPIGDVRHAMTALRFMHEFGEDAIPTPEISRAMRKLLARPELAAAAIVDLARWQDWESLPDVTALFTKQGYTDAATTRAIVGYLSACPLPAGAEALARLRRTDAKRVREAEESGLLTLPGR